MESKKGGVQMKKVPETTSKFIKIRCPKCKNEQIMFGKASTTVKCLVCSKVLAEPTGGKSRVKARVLEVLE
jgi:small subunit ribosomal protein S27e